MPTCSDHQDTKYTLGEKLLINIHEIIGDRNNVVGDEFIPNRSLLSQLVMIDESPGEITEAKISPPRTLAFLLEPFAIKPARNRTQKERGYYIADFIQPWKRAVKLENAFGWGLREEIHGNDS